MGLIITVRAKCLEVPCILNQMLENIPGSLLITVVHPVTLNIKHRIRA